MTSPLRSVPPGRLVLLRHGQTTWSLSGRHTGHTDLALTPVGEEEARSLAPALGAFDVVRVVSSPLQRAARTAELAGLTGAETDDHLTEWDYGAYEGLTTPQIRERTGRPWTVWADGVPLGDPDSATPGETIEQVAARTQAAIDAVFEDLHCGDVVLFGHGHLLRVLAAVWLRREPQFGAHLALASGSLSVLGREHETPAIRQWNTVPAPAEVPRRA